MPVGLQAWNDGGLFQIDNDFRNLQFTQRIDVNTSNRSGSIWYSDITFNNVNTPIAAIYSPNKVFLLQLAKSGNSVTYRVFSNAQNGFVAVMLFDTSQSSGGNVGQQVFDSGGNLIFDSSRGYMKILDVISGEVPVNQFPMPSFGQSYSGRTVAVAAGVRYSGVAVQYTGVGPNAPYMIFHFSAMASSWGDTFQAETVGTEAFGPFQGSVVSGNSQQPYYNYLILDVTNLI